MRRRLHRAAALGCTRGLARRAPRKLEGFASEFGPRFYGLPADRDTITLVREEWTVPEKLPFGGEELVPLRAGETLPWKIL